MAATTAPFIRELVVWGRVHRPGMGRKTYDYWDPTRVAVGACRLSSRLSSLYDGPRAPCGVSALLWSDVRISELVAVN